jgi:multicomponent K+:H+ antiporter subunit A
VLGVLHVPSAMFFDVGIFAVVVGSTLLTLIALAHQSIRGRRLSAQAADDALERDAS